MPEVAEAGLSLAVYSDLREGFAYLRTQPTVRALGITHSILMAGVVSANVLGRGAGCGYPARRRARTRFSGSRLGIWRGDWRPPASQLPHRLRLTLYAFAIAGLALGHFGDAVHHVCSRGSFFSDCCSDYFARFLAWWRRPR